jgi:D-inositol-3-phosphate glycosyltransferase
MAGMAHGEEAHGRVAVLSLHTSPLDPPGTGDSGGMNVFVRSVADRLAGFGIEVDVYTRCAGRGVPEVHEVGPLTRVIQVPAGPCAPVDKLDLPALVPAFTDAVLDHPALAPYDLVHAHYWLSGWAARRAKEAWGVPLVASFHTLGMVKNLAPGRPEGVEPAIRLAGERAVIDAADLVLAPTPSEAVHLARLYGAHPTSIRVVPPGVDARRFRPRPAAAARARLGVEGKRVVLFVGRVQRHKGPDVAIRALAEIVRTRPDIGADLVLVIVGGPSGTADEVSDLRSLARQLGLTDRVLFLPPRPHEELPEVYAAADVLVMPSRSESFGLVALEAQACGVPVVAAAVGGLRHVVAEGTSGLLVRGHDPAAFARQLVTVLEDRELARALSDGAVRQAAMFPWEATATRLLSVYGELVPALGRFVADDVPA